MKTVLLTESEYRKVCQILGEDVDDVVNRNAQKKNQYGDAAEKYNKELNYRHSIDNYSGVVFKFVKEKYGVDLMDYTKKYGMHVYGFTDKDKANEFIKELIYMVKNTSNSAIVERYGNIDESKFTIGKKYITVYLNISTKLIEDLFVEFYKSEMKKGKDSNDREYAGIASGRDTLIANARRELDRKVKSNYKELVEKFIHELDEKLNERFLKRFGAFSIIDPEIEICNGNEYVYRGDAKDGDELRIRFDTYHFTVRERSNSTRMYKNSLEKNIGKIIKNVINNVVIGKVVDGKNLVVDVNFDIIDTLVDKIMSNIRD